MKKIVTMAAALACAASMFAVDFSASVVMEGNIAGGKDDGSAYIWNLSKKDQKDADALIISANAGKAGAQFQFWYNYDGKDAAAEAALEIRNTRVWFKPLDMMTVTVGDVSTGMFGNTLDYWKNPIGASKAQSDSWDGKYQSFATVEGSGINIDVTPVSGLLITAGITAGAGNNFVSMAKDVDATVAAYGAGVKYDLSGVAGIPLNVGVQWKDAGTKARKVLAVGASYGNPYGDFFHGMLNVRMCIDDTNAAYDGSNTGDMKLRGIAFDNYFKINSGALQVHLRAPVTIRVSGDDGDDSYMQWSAKVQYAMDGFTPYVLMGSDIDNNGAMRFAKFAEDFEMQIQPGVTFSVGSCAMDVAAKIMIAPKGTSDKNALSWGIPFNARVSF